MGPIIIFDKSTLQSLSVDESCWLENFFFTNITPLFYVETLADLAKTSGTKRTAEEIVGELALKTPTSSASSNRLSKTLVVQDLLGNSIAMSNRVIVGGGQPKRDTDGKVGMHFDKSPESIALSRWQAGDFEEVERSAARKWRDNLAIIDFDSRIRWVRNIIPPNTKFRSLAEIKNFVDDFVQQSSSSLLNFALQFLLISGPVQSAVVSRYEKAGRPVLSVLAPYAAYVLKVELFFYIGLLSSLISKDRPSNKIDLAYLYYLPFCQVFVSTDKLHKNIAPLFMEIGQEFVWGTDLKASLGELDDYYSKHVEEIEKVGIMSFAPFPPKEMENEVTRLWDKFLASSSRKGAKPDSEEGAVSKKMRDVKIPRVAESQPTNINITSDEADYVMIKRKIAARKGKWRILSPEVEKSGQESKID